MSLADYYTEKNTYTKVSRGRLNGILTLLGKEAATVLDIGCGAGEVGRVVKDRSRMKVYGVDISTNAVATARTVLDGAEVCDFETESILPDSFKGISFDAVIVSEVLEHLFEPEKMLQHIRLATSAPIIITVPNVLFWKNRLKIFFGSFEYTETGMMDRGHIHFFTWKSLQEVIAKGGYQITTTAHHVPTRGTKLFAKYSPGLFCYQFIVRLMPLAGRDNK